MIRKWIGVVLRRSQAEPAGEVARPVVAAAKSLTGVPLFSTDGLSVGELSVHFAFVALWSGEIPAMVKPGQRDKKIMGYLKTRSDLSQIGPTTIKRYLRKRNAAAARQLALRGSRKTP
jgi:hypothetical protein